MADRDANDFSLGQGDDKVPWTVSLVDGDGNAIDPTGGSVVLHYRVFDNSAAAIEVAGVVIAGVGGQPGQVRYVFQSSDTTAAAVYRAVWIVTLASGEVITYPAIFGRGWLQFEVIANP